MSKFRAQERKTPGPIRGPIVRIRFDPYSKRTAHGVFRDAHNVLIETISEDIRTTKDDVQNLVQHISTNFVGKIPGVEPAGIPLNPIQANYKMTVYWGRGPWLLLRNKSGEEGDPIVCRLYLEDEFGEALPTEIKDEILRDAKGFWNDQLRLGRASELKMFQNLGFVMRNEFRVALEGKFPWLRLCHGHWKVYQLWIDHFGTWAKTHLPRGPTIVISSDSDDTGVESLPKGRKHSQKNNKDGSVGGKRNREDREEDGPSKKHKGKDREVATRPLDRPLPTKTKAKVPRVSDLPFRLAGHLLTPC